jgi:hypothetical protein
MKIKGKLNSIKSDSLDVARKKLLPIEGKIGKRLRLMMESKMFSI